MELYRIDAKEDPISISVKCWAILCEIDAFKESISGYYWNAAGELPVLRYKHHVFTKHHILEFLQLTYDLDCDLTHEEKALASLLQEICESRLYPALLYTMWMDDTTSKDFFTPKQNFVIGLLSSPLTKVRFLLEKNAVKEYLGRQHGINSQEEAKIRYQSAHSVLSTMLGSKKFFFSRSGRKEIPRSTDLIVYAYLSYEFRQNLCDAMGFIENYPQNLLEFIARVENCMRLKERAGNVMNAKLQYVTLRREEEEYYCSKIYANPMELGNDSWNRIAYKLGGEVPVERYKNTDNMRRRAFITGTALVLFVFIYLQRRN